MTIYRTPYDTTQCDGFEPGVLKTQAQLKAADAMGALCYVAPNMVLVQDGDARRDNIPGFTHPMVIDAKLNNEQERPRIAADVRPFGAWNRNQDAFLVRDKSQMDMALLRLRLSSIWLTADRAYLRNVSPIPVKMFASWISESLQRKFAIDPLEQMRISILAGILYNSNFSDDTDLDENERVRLAASLGRDLGIEVKEILAVVDEFPVLASVDEFCKAAVKLGGIRLAELNRGLLYGSVAGAWFGYNYKEVLTTALEHPPTWLAVVYTAGNDRTYLRTGLSDLFKRSHRGGTDQLFFNGTRKLVENFAPLTGNQGY
jgi:hypothetical protein